jgi:hypothetical protein
VIIEPDERPTATRLGKKPYLYQALNPGTDLQKTRFHSVPKALQFTSSLSQALSSHVVAAQATLTPIVAAPPTLISILLLPLRSSCTSPRCRCSLLPHPDNKRLAQTSCFGCSE